jgi:hypothetical protein
VEVTRLPAAKSTTRRTRLASFLCQSMVLPNILHAACCNFLSGHRSAMSALAVGPAWSCSKARSFLASPHCATARSFSRARRERGQPFPEGAATAVGMRRSAAVHGSPLVCLAPRRCRAVAVRRPAGLLPDVSTWPTDPACGRWENAAAESKQISGLVTPRVVCWLLAAAQGVCVSA